MTAREMIEALRKLPPDTRMMSIFTCECCTEGQDITAEHIALSEAGHDTILVGSVGDPGQTSFRYVDLDKDWPSLVPN